MEENEIIILLVVVIFVLVIGGIYYEFYYKEKANCYNDNDLSEAYLNATIDTVNYVSFQLINQSSYCNEIPVQWKDENNETYSTNLISINCLKAANQNE